MVYQLALPVSPGNFSSYGKGTSLPYFPQLRRLLLTLGSGIEFPICLAGESRSSAIESRIRGTRPQVRFSGQFPARD